MLAHSDLSVAHCDDLRTRLEYAILITVERHRVNWISFQNYKRRGVDRSVLGREPYALADCLDAAFALQQVVSRSIGRALPLIILTDFASAIKTLVKSSTISDRRLMIDSRAAREVFDKNEIIDVR